jgi:hypothetical protein
VDFVDTLYLKYAIVSEQLIVPRLEECASAQITQDGAITCQQNYFILIFFCLFAGWGEHPGK